MNVPEGVTSTVAQLPIPLVLHIDISHRQRDIHSGVYNAALLPRLLDDSLEGGAGDEQEYLAEPAT